MSYSHHSSSSLPPLSPSLPPPPPSLPSRPMVPMPFVPLSVRVRRKVPLKGSPVLHHFHGVRQPVTPNTFVLPLPSVIYRCTLWYPCTAHSPQLSYSQGAHPSIFLSSCYRGPRFLRERLRLDVFIRFLRTLVSISPCSMHHCSTPLHSTFAPTIISSRCPPFYLPFQLLPWSPFLTGAATTRRVYLFLTDTHLHLSMLNAPLLNPLAQPNPPNYYIPKVLTLLSSFPVVTAVPVSCGSGYDQTCFSISPCSMQFPNTIAQPPYSATATENTSVHVSNP
jgi:hypothetical protein